MGEGNSVFKSLHDLLFNVIHLYGRNSEQPGIHISQDKFGYAIVTNESLRQWLARGQKMLKCHSLQMTYGGSFTANTNLQAKEVNIRCWIPPPHPKISRGYSREKEGTQGTQTVSNMLT